MTIMRRGSTYHLHKRVPRRFEGVEERKSIWVSLHTEGDLRHPWSAISFAGAARSPLRRSTTTRRSNCSLSS